MKVAYHLSAFMICGTHMRRLPLSAGVHPEVVERIDLSDSTVSITDTYSRRFQQQDEAAEPR